MTCPVCDAPEAGAFYARRGVPVLLNAPQPDAARARAVPRGDLLLRGCSACGFVYNAAFDPGRTPYTAEYLNNQEHSPQFAAYLDEVVARQGPSPGRVLEIGCGKGAFLRQLCAATDAEGWGYDTTYTGPAQVGRARFSDERYAGGALFGRVVARHVLEHVPAPLELLRLARGALLPGGQVFVEVPDLGWIVENIAFWDLFYEHVGYFSPASLARAAARTGFDHIRVTPAFGGQYLWLEATAAPLPPRHDRVSQHAAAGVPLPPRLDAAALGAFAAEVERREARWSAQLGAWAGRAALWGAGAKGVTFANLLDPDGHALRGLIDIHPAKQGRHIPGSGHPVFGPEVLRRGEIDHILVTNGNYLAEVRATVAALAPSVTLHAL